MARSQASVRALVVLVLGVLAGLAAAFLAPRALTTSTQALIEMAMAVSVGAVGGWLLRTRWALILLAGGWLVATELGRSGTVGPTMRDLRFDTTYGIVAFAINRGLEWLLVLPALALGVLLGIAVARRRAPVSQSVGRRLPVGSWLLGVAVVGLAGLVAMPASTPPVTGVDGRPLSHGIAELTTVRLGGSDQVVMIRAAHDDNPVLLYLSGGPGQSDLALSRSLSTGWVRDFVFVDLDQRGNGKSYPAIDPVSSMTVDQAVSDVIELTEYLRSRFAEEKIYLMGESWGTILGTLAVQRRPDLYHAWIGSGQMVDILETDRRIYSDLVAYASRTGDTALAATLDEVGPPPYRDFPWTNSNLLAWYELLYKPYTPSSASVARADAAGLDPFGVLGSEYSFIEKANVLRGLIDTFYVLYPQLYDLDLRQDVQTLEVPVYILDGAAELQGRRALVTEWFDQLEAPTKQLITYQDAAHSVAFEQADEVQRLLNETIVPATYGR